VDARAHTHTHTHTEQNTQHPKIMSLSQLEAKNTAITSNVLQK